MHIYLTCWNKLILIPTTSLCISLIIVGNIVQTLAEVQDDILSFYLCGPIYHDTQVPGPVSQSGAESNYNEACTTGVALIHFRMWINETLNKDSDILTEESPLIILDSKSAACMATNGKDTKYTRHIYTRVNFVRSDQGLRAAKVTRLLAILGYTRA